MADHAHRIEADEEIEFEFELENVDDIPEAEWDDEMRAAVAAADADAKAGRLVPHEQVMEWLSRVGTPDETPMPAEWLRG